mgnify:FL=1
MIAREISNIQETVERLLRENPDYRDSDEKLWARIVQDSLGGVTMLQNMSAYELLRLYVSDKLVSFESVSRARRKVQEIHKELRGKKYKERQNHQEQVKEVLGYKA